MRRAVATLLALLALPGAAHAQGYAEVEVGAAASAGLWGGRCTTVVHALEGSPLARRRPARGAIVMRLRPAQLRYAVRPDIPDTGMEYRTLAEPLTDIPLLDAEIERWWDMRAAIRNRRGLLEHRLLGYVTCRTAAAAAGGERSDPSMPGAT